MRDLQVETKDEFELLKPHSKTSNNKESDVSEKQRTDYLRRNPLQVEMIGSLLKCLQIIKRITQN